MKKGVVSEQLMIEYMLRYHCKMYLKSTFPFIPLSFFKEILA